MSGGKRPVAGTLVAACTALILAACAGDDVSEESESAASAPPAATATQPDQVRRFGFIRSVDASATPATPATITFDEAEWLVGEPAQQAAEEDGEVPPGEPVPNDYYIRNRDTQTRVLQLALDVRVTAAQPVTLLFVRPPARCRSGCEDFPVSLADFLASFPQVGSPEQSEGRHGASSRYWVTLRGDVVVAIDEQYVP